jgi:serine protease Do
LEFNGTQINEMKELPIIVAQTEVGKTVDVKIWRNKKEINKKIKLGRLETSSDFKEEKKVDAETPEISEIKSLKIIARPLNQKDIEQRKLPNQTTGLVITNIGKNSPVNYLNVGDIIVEAQKKKIRSIKDLEDIVDKALKSNQKTILIVIYNNQNQRRYIGVKLD